MFYKLADFSHSVFQIKVQLPELKENSNMCAHVLFFKTSCYHHKKHAVKVKNYEWQEPHIKWQFKCWKAFDWYRVTQQKQSVK